MPTVSPAQKRLMQGVAHSPAFAKKVGIPQRVGREFVAADDRPRAAGIAFVTPDQRVLFLRRAGDDHRGEWGLPAGHLEDGETSRQAALREAREETGTELFLERGPLSFRHRHTTPDGVDFTTFEQPVVEAFEPTLNDEHDTHRWASINNLPNPLHPGLKAVLGRLAMDAKGSASVFGLAFDASSVREYRDGRLHVGENNISKAAVNPYVGKEIPNYKALKLDPEKIYFLLRDPKELAKAAHTFNNLPILSEHRPVTTDKFPESLVIGTTGSNARYDHPHVKNDLALWKASGIKSVESQRAKELSSAYRFRADMTPGQYQGADYDGVMRDIFGNHVALVKEGRAGSDVVVGDSMERVTMARNLKIDGKGMLARGALMAFLAPKLAMDAKLDLAPYLKGITSKNFAKKKAGIAAAIEKGLDGKLAEDASIEGLVELLDAVDGVKAEDAELDANAGPPPIAAKEEDDEEVGDADPLAAAMAFLKGKLSDEDLAKLQEMMSGGGAVGDEPPEFLGKPGEPGKEKTPMTAKDAAEMVDKAVKKKGDEMAKDTATQIAAALKAAADDQKALREAERAVRPYVGELGMAHDSAEAVYRTALGALGVKDVEKVPAAALPHILAAQQLPGRRQATEPVIAMDEARAKGFADRFPGADRIGQV